MAELVRDDPTELPTLRACPLDPPPEYDQLRAERPISKVKMPNGVNAWLITRYDDLRAMLADPRFSADRRKPGFPTQIGNQRQFTKRPPVMLTMDGDEHSAARRAVIGEFTVKRIQALQPRIQQIVDECISRMMAGKRPLDLVTELALPVPSLVICELLGVPYADHDYFQSRTRRMLNRNTPDEERVAAVDELADYLDRVVANKMDHPSDDLISRQIDRQRAEGKVDRESLVSQANFLLGAGHETTANMISLGTLGLLLNPDELDLIRRDPAKTPLAVEELLRYFSIVSSGVARIATEDVELGGVLIRAGEGVIAPIPAANHDGAVFADPNHLNIERGARHHVAFGYGPHQCLGQNLARAELQVVFDTLFRRIPDLRLAVPVEELPFKDDSFIYGLYELPVTW